MLIAFPLLVASCTSIQKISSNKAETQPRQAVKAENVWADQGMPGLPLKEKLVYHVKWLGIAAGEITAEITGVEELNGRQAYRIEVTARTVGICSKIYRIEDKYVSFLDVKEGHTLRHEVHRREGGYRKDAVTHFDQENHKAYFHNLTDGSRKVYDIPPHVQDTVTAAYMARFLPLSESPSFSFSVSNSEKIYELTVNVVDHDKEVIAGLENVFHMRPFARHKGEQVREGRVSGYVTADDKRLPVLVVIKAPVFTAVTARLKGY